MNEAIIKDNDNQKDLIIIINGRKYTVENNELAFEQVVKLAFGEIPNEQNSSITITYEKARVEKRDDKPDGILMKGGTVKIEQGTIFNVAITTMAWTIIINGRSYIVNEDVLTFEYIVGLVFKKEDLDKPQIAITVTYENADEVKSDGVLVAGQSVKIQERTVFNVTETNNS